MKNAGFIIIAMGLLVTIFTGFNYITEKKIMDTSELEITKNKNHVVMWTPLIGVAVVVGAGVYLYGRKVN